MLSSVSQAFARFQPFCLDLNVPISVSARMVPQLPEKVSAKILCFEPATNFWPTFPCPVLVLCPGREEGSRRALCSQPTAPAPCSSASCSVPVQGCCKLQCCSMPACMPDGGAHEKIQVVYSVCSLFMPLNLFRVLLNRMARKVTKPSFSRHNCSLCSQTSPS